MFIQVHLIQSVPASNSNAGQDGSPKHFDAWGSTRVTQSSQAQKRAARQWYQKYGQLDRKQFASRSRVWDTVLAGYLKVGKDDAQKLWIARILLGLFNIKPEKIFDVALEGVQNLLFFADHEVQELANIAGDHEGLLLGLCDRIAAYQTSLAEEKKFSNFPKKSELRGLLKAIGEISEALPGDVALFGRMMANMQKQSVDGCVQVAFAVSVNSFRRQKTRDGWKVGELDFFSAIDDFASQEPASADSGMIGEKPYAAPVLYRYANVCVTEAVKLMGDSDAAQASVRAFIEGFIRSLPSGGGNSFAHQTLPEFVLIEVGPYMPYNHAAAFEVPIDSPEKGRSIGQIATNKLMERRETMYKIYGGEPLFWGVTGLDGYAQNPVPLSQLVDDAIAATSET